MRFTPDIAPSLHPPSRLQPVRQVRRWAAGLLLGTVLVSTAQAGLVTWTLQNVAFADGGTASGWFQWDASAWNPTMATYDPWYTGGDYGDYSIQTSGAPGLGWHYDSSDGENIGYFTNLWGILGLAWAGYGLGTPYLDLMLAQELTDAGGTVALTGGWECSDVENTICRRLVAGSVTTEAAASLPEPSSLALVGLALTAALGVTLRRKARAPR